MQSYIRIVLVVLFVAFCRTDCFTLHAEPSATTAVAADSADKHAADEEAYEGSNAFEIFWSAIKLSRQGLWITVQFLVLITIILAIILYLSEFKLQPKDYNFRQSLVWTFTRYIGDPGRLADAAPQSFVGRFIATIIGVLCIAIVAVPAGILGSGFNEALENENTKRRIIENRKKLHSFFERKLDRPTGYQAVVFFKSFADITARTGMSENEIIEIVQSTPGFRIVNLASTIPVAQKPSDRLAIEHHAHNTPYGVFIDRNSPVTIVATSNLTDAGVSTFSFYLALIGNFNYISREFGDKIVFKSVMTKKDDSEYSPAELQYFSDLKKLMSRPGSWSFDIVPASGSNEITYDTELHFGIGNAKGVEEFEGKNLLVRDVERYKRFYAAVSDSMKVRFDILCDNGKYHNSSGKQLWPRALNLPADANSVILRVAWSVMLWNDERLLVAKTLAECINEQILGKRDVKEPEVLMEKGFGFDGYDL